MIRTLVIPTITAAGSAGSAVGSGTSGSPANGGLLAIKVVQAGSPAATTDITITITNGTTTRTLLTLTDYNTASAWFNVRAPAHGQTGAALVFAATDGVPVEIPLDGYVSAAIAQGDPNQTLTVTLQYRE